MPMPFFLGLKLDDSVTGGAAAVSATAPLPATVVADPGSAGAVGCWAQATAPPRATSRAKAIDFMGHSSYMVNPRGITSLFFNRRTSFADLRG